MIRWTVLFLAACDSGAAKPASITNAAKQAQPAGDTATLTWVVGPATIPHPKWPDTFLAPVTLEVAIGGVTRPLELEPQQGSLFPFNQTVCKTTAYPLDPGEIAKITFYEGGAGGYAVKRPKPDTLAVFSWALSDGACADDNGDPVACPSAETAGPTMQIPATVTVTEAIVQVDKSGKRAPINCAQ